MYSAFYICSTFIHPRDFVIISFYNLAIRCSSTQPSYFSEINITSKIYFKSKNALNHLESLLDKHNIHSKRYGTIVIRINCSRYSFTFSLLYALRTFSNWKSFDFIILLLPGFGSILLEFTISLKLTSATLTSRLKPSMVLYRFIFAYCSALKILLKL